MTHWLTALLLLLLVFGCASTVPRTVFRPKETPTVRSFFRNGAAIGAVSGDSVFALTQVEPVLVGSSGRRYIRLWVLFENNSSSPLLIEPLKCTSLQVESTHETAGRGSTNPIVLTPESPTRILAAISNEQAAAAILGTIGATLEAAAVQPTQSRSTYKSPTGAPILSSQTTYDDAGEKQRAILNRSSAQIASTESWYESYKNSVNSGILRRNTLFPGEGVHGFIYFRAPSNQPSGPRRRYVVKVSLPAGERAIVFEPIEGE